MTTTKNGNGVSQWWRTAIPAALGVLLPGGGFVASQTIEHGKAIAVQKEAMIHLQREQKIRDENLNRRLERIEAALKK